jgi:hypothetical protein
MARRSSLGHSGFPDRQHSGLRDRWILRPPTGQPSRRRDDQRSGLREARTPGSPAVQQLVFTQEPSRPAAWQSSSPAAQQSSGQVGLPVADGPKTTLSHRVLLTLAQNQWNWAELRQQHRGRPAVPKLGASVRFQGLDIGTSNGTVFEAFRRDFGLFPRGLPKTDVFGTATLAGWKGDYPRQNEPCSPIDASGE